MTTIFKSKFGQDNYYLADQDGLHSVYLGNYKPTELLTAVNGAIYFTIDESRLLPRKSSKTGKTYYKILNK